MGETRSVMRKDLMGPCLGFLIAVFSSGIPVAAQTPAAADKAPLDVLYVQSRVLAFPDEDWPYPHPTEPLFITDIGEISLPAETERSLRELRLLETDSE